MVSASTDSTWAVWTHFKMHRTSTDSSKNSGAAFIIEGAEGRYETFRADTFSDVPCGLGRFNWKVTESRQEKMSTLRGEAWNWIGMFRPETEVSQKMWTGTWKHQLAVDRDRSWEKNVLRCVSELYVTRPFSKSSAERNSNMFLCMKWFNYFCTIADWFLLHRTVALWHNSITEKNYWSKRRYEK